MEKKSFLPDEFELSHWFSFFLHDQLVETLKFAEKANSFHSEIELKDEKHQKLIEGMIGEELISWLEENGYKKDVVGLYYKQLFAALLSDFLHFIYESLQCSSKGKLTVAYALLRKPLKENLFYMEWLLARPGDFLDRFEAENPNRFKLPHPNNSSEPEHKKIIKEAMKNTVSGEWIDSNFLHELRFKKKSPVSLEPTWQKANHLVTTFRHMKTESCNLNFVFSNADSHYIQWKNYYQFVPILLFHAVEVVEALLAKFATRECHKQDIMPLRTVAGMMLYLQNSPWESNTETLFVDFGKSLEKAKSACPKCGNFFNFDNNNLTLLYNKGSVSCYNGCGKVCLQSDKF